MFPDVFTHEVSSVSRSVCKENFSGRFVFLTDRVHQTCCFPGKKNSDLLVHVESG